MNTHFWETLKQVVSITECSSSLMQSQNQSTLDFELDQIRAIEGMLARRTNQLKQKNPDVGTSGSFANTL
jgi:hypothetical protein